ncbi:MAG: hypothetical protein AAB590_00880 [Patescibacteria group bacterium]
MRTIGYVVLAAAVTVGTLTGAFYNVESWWRFWVVLALGGVALVYLGMRAVRELEVWFSGLPEDEQLRIAAAIKKANEEAYRSPYHPPPYGGMGM